MMTSDRVDIWKTPGPWLGLLLGLGTPAVVLLHAFVGWPAGLAALALLGAACLAVFLQLRGNMALAYGNAALRRYSLRMLVASIAYVAALLVAVALFDGGALTGPVLFALAVLPTLPALGMVWAMGRYLMEEEDEYLLHRASVSALIGLGFVLALGTVWGFMETFGLAPHVWAWWVVPVFAIGLGIRQGLLARRDRAGEEEAE